MKTIPASEMIAELRKMDKYGEELIKFIQEDIDLLGKNILEIEIESDGDFLINGSNVFNGMYVIENGDVGKTYINAISSIKFGKDGVKNEKLDRFLELLFSEDLLMSLINTGEIDAGGNHTISASVGVNNYQFMTLLSYELDLSR